MTLLACTLDEHASRCVWAIVVDWFCVVKGWVCEWVSISRTTQKSIARFLIQLPCDSSPTHSLTQQVNTITHPLTRSRIHSFSQLLTHSVALFNYSPKYALIYSSIHLLTPSIEHYLSHSQCNLDHPITRTIKNTHTQTQIIQSFTQWTIRFGTHSLTSSLAHSITSWHSDWITLTRLLV